MFMLHKYIIMSNFPSFSRLIKIQLPQRPKQSSKSWVPTIIFFNDTVLLIYFGIKGKASRTMDVLPHLNKVLCSQSKKFTGSVSKQSNFM